MGAGGSGQASTSEQAVFRNEWRIVESGRSPDLFGKPKCERLPQFLNIWCEWVN